MILVFTAGMCSANQFCTCFRSSIESSKRQSTRYTVLPSRLSGRGADAFLLILGGKPTGLRTVIFSGLDSGILTVESELGVATILFMFLVPRRNVLSNIGPAVRPGQALRPTVGWVSVGPSPEKESRGINPTRNPPCQPQPHGGLRVEQRPPLHQRSGHANPPYERSGACREIAERRDRCGGAIAGHCRKLGD